MAQPATLPRWSESGTGIGPNIVEPNEARKDSGFVTGGDVPTSGEVNWILWALWQWVKYLRDLAGEAFTWTQLHVFQGGLRSTQAPLIGADVVRLTELNAEATARGAAITAARAYTDERGYRLRVTAKWNGVDAYAVIATSGDESIFTGIDNPGGGGQLQFRILCGDSDVVATFHAGDAGITQPISIAWSKTGAGAERIFTVRNHRWNGVDAWAEFAPTFITMILYEIVTP